MLNHPFINLKGFFIFYQPCCHCIITVNPAAGTTGFINIREDMLERYAPEDYSSILGG